MDFKEIQKSMAAEVDILQKNREKNIKLINDETDNITLYKKHIKEAITRIKDARKELLNSRKELFLKSRMLKLASGEKLTEVVEKQKRNRKKKEIIQEENIETLI